MLVHIYINLYMDLARKLGWSRRELVVDKERVRVRDVIEFFEDLRNAVMNSPRSYMILVNGINIMLLNNFDTEISGDTTIDIFPPAGGG